MTMMAIFACNGCGTESVHGYASGHDKSGYGKAPNEYVCVKCLAKKPHQFVTYRFVDERSDADRMRDQLRAKSA